MLATRPIGDRRAVTVAKAIHCVFSQELGFPSRVIVDRGSEIAAVDTRADLNSYKRTPIKLGGESTPDIVEHPASYQGDEEH